MPGKNYVGENTHYLLENFKYFHYNVLCIKPKPEGTLLF